MDDELARQETNRVTVMKHLSDHRGVDCPSCDAVEGMRCRGERACLERVWSAVNRWWSDYYVWSRSLPCPTCFAPAGWPCRDGGNRTKKATLYGAMSHANRVRAIERMTRGGSRT